MKRSENWPGKPGVPPARKMAVKPILSDWEQEE
jgi:hypothetical protein